MPSRHHRWQTRWRVDPATHQAQHDSGLVVFFDCPPRAGAPPGRPVNAAEVASELAVVHGHNVPAMLARLLREAQRIYSEDRSVGYG